jgi:hypothetical protein
VSSNFFYYEAKNNSQSGNPGSGHILWNNVTMTASTQININHLTDTPVTDIDIFLALLQVGQQITIQDQNDSGNYQVWIITGSTTQIVGASNYWEVPVSLVSAAGTAQFSNNHKIILATLGATGTNGTSGTSGTNGSAGTSGTSFASPYVGNVQITSGQTWITLPTTGTTTSATTINWNNGNTQEYVLGSSTTFTFSNPNAGATYILIIRQSSGGSNTTTWPGTVSWAGGTPPTMTATANKFDVFTFVYDGSKYFGSYVQNFT